MDSVTLTVLVILSFLLVWLGIMIFTTKPEEEEATIEKNEEKHEEKHEDNRKNTIEKYEKMIAELEEKIKKLETKPTNDKLLDWLTDLKRENEFLKMKMAQFGNIGIEPYKYENDKMKQEMEHYKERVKKLEDELAEMKNNLNYYRIMVNRLQGRYTIINKYNYRMCIRNPETGEYQYELVKLPQDFDPFNPTYITRDGIEVYEEYGLRIPTRLGDIIRENFKKDAYLKDFELGR
ncbi:MAG: hypothetical protein J7J36_03220 [Thermoplasmata archaeon]|nr:hypothetical protein [Thermoplasmata archaeon]